MKGQKSKWRALSLCTVLGSTLAGCGASPQNISSPSGAQSASQSEAQSQALGGQQRPSQTSSASEGGASKAQPIAPSYTSAEESFALWLPGKPTELVRQVSVPGAGLVRVRTISLSTPKAVYVVVPTSVPESVSLSNPDPFLDGVQAGFVASSRGKLVSSKSIKLGQYPGREIVVSVGASKITVHIFLGDKRSYQVMAVLPPGQPITDAQTTKVLDSFQILSR